MPDDLDAVADAAYIKAAQLRDHNRKLQGWLEQLRSAPPEELLGISEEERDKLRAIKKGTMELQASGTPPPAVLPAWVAVGVPTPPPAPAPIRRSRVSDRRANCRS